MLGETAVPLWRRLVAGVLGLVSVGVLWNWAGTSEIWVASPAVIALVLAAVAIHVPHLGAQLFARAAWWATVGFGFIITLVSSGSEVKDAFAYLLPAAVALPVAGRRGIAEAEERAGRVAGAFRSSLFVLMVLALADAQTFAVFGLISGKGISGASAILFASSAALVVGFIGLFRLAPWGAIVNLVTCALLVVFAVAGTFHEKSSLGAAVGALAGVHVLVATPLVAAVLLGKTLPAAPARLRTFGMSAVLVVLVVVSGLRVLVR